MKSIFTFLCLLGFAGLVIPSRAAAVAAAPLVTGLELRPNGSFSIDRINVFAGHFDRDWHRAEQQRILPAGGYPRMDGEAWQTRVALAARGGAPIALAQWVERLDEIAFRLRYEASHPVGLPSREMFIQLEIPLTIGAGQEVELDGTTHRLPAEFGGPRLFGSEAVGLRRLVLPGASGKVVFEGSFSLLAQDLREWKSDHYSVRLRFSPREETLLNAALELNVRVEPYRSEALSLRQAANFGFRDEVADDRRGGWTDQGPDNDLRMLPAGLLSASGVSFEILDERANSGRAAIVLGRSGQGFLPRSVALPVPAGAAAKEWRNLYLLHASAWTPSGGSAVGRVVLRHVDGTESRREIVSGRDVGNWWSPVALENGAVGWVGDNPSSQVGLFVSRVPLGEKTVSEVRFESAGPAMWMIAAVSASTGNIVPFTPATPWTAAAGGEWSVHDHEVHIEAGSVFDFSSALDAPAGKHGRLVITPEGRFEFADRPGERARFWGVNLCFGANFPDRATADLMAEQLARSGYNSVRFHHYDREIQLKGGRSWDLDPEKLDRFDYLFAAMKKRGLYINLDLYTSRAFSPEEFSELGFDPSTDTSTASGEMHWRFKALMPVSEKAFETWSRFARNLLTHRNPYTGLTWAEDPALVGICPVNEDSPGGRIDSDPVIARAYREAFAVWRADPAGHLLPAVPGETEDVAFNRFVHEAHIHHDDRLRTFLHGLGVRVPLTGANHRRGQGLALVRERYDYVDIHQYHDHPAFPQRRFQLPFLFRQDGSVQAAASTPRVIMPARILGKPFAATEFNFVRPNRHRAEGGVLMPAYASLQDWDALYNFEYTGSAQNVVRPSARGTFSIVGDPIGMLADRVGAAIFLRGDIAPARSELGFAVSDIAFAGRERAFPEAFSRLGLVARIGSRTGDPEDVLRAQAPAAVVVEPSVYKAGADRRVYAADDTLADRLERDGVLPSGSVTEGGKR